MRANVVRQVPLFDAARLVTGDKVQPGLDGFNVVS